MSRWRYNGAQLAAVDEWIENSAPHQLMYLPRLRGDGTYEAVALMLDYDTDPIMASVVVCHLELHPDGKITQVDGVIRWDQEGIESAP